MLLTSNDLTPNGVRISLRVLSALACLATLGLCIHSSISFSKHHLFAYISVRQLNEAPLQRCIPLSDADNINSPLWFYFLMQSHSLGF